VEASPFVANTLTKQSISLEIVLPSIDNLIGFVKEFEAF
jgi:hypothetical protein